MSKPRRWLYWKNEKEKAEQRMSAWQTKHDLMTDPETPAHVRLAATEEILDRIDGKVTAKLEHSGDPSRPVKIKTEGFDWDAYAKLFSVEIGTGQSAVNGNGTDKSVHTPHTNGSAGSVS